MSFSAPQIALLGLLIGLSGALLSQAVTQGRLAVPAYVRYLCVLFMAFSVSEWVSFTGAVWILAVLSFLALREYLSLIDIRLQDRWGILGAYLSIPFMFYLIQVHWYGMFIISIPVYTFLVIPLLIAAGGHDTKGTVFSIGAIDFGLFLFVYCLGHIAFLALFSTWMASFLVAGVALSDLIHRSRSLSRHSGLRGTIVRYMASAPVTVALAACMSGWMTLPFGHSVALGLLVPALVLAGNFAISSIEFDLGIDKDRLIPGTGQIIHAVKSFLFTAPVVFHYIRYFWEEPVFG